MNKNEYKQYATNILFSTDKICMIQKPEYGIGSSTILLDYMLKRMTYESDYKILVIFNSIDEYDKFLNLENAQSLRIIDNVYTRENNSLMFHVITAACPDEFLNFNECVLLDYIEDVTGAESIVSPLFAVCTKEPEIRLVAEYQVLPEVKVVDEVEKKEAVIEDDI